jgi:high-affinity Fe2+/Pb2+ permease
MSANRHLWALPLILVGIAVAIYLAFAFTRGDAADQSEWLAEWASFLSVFLVFAAAALLAYRMLRRSRAEAARDEARPKQGS